MLQTEFTDLFHKLTPKPRSVFILLLEGKQDEEIAEEIGASEATVRKHVQNLCDHFTIPAEVAGIRKNRRQELIRIAADYMPELVKERRQAQKEQHSEAKGSLTIKHEPPSEPTDWDGSPDVSVFYGRTKDLKDLKSWIIDDGCRMLALLGMSGIGKTTLSVKLAQNIQDEFDYVIWRSLQNSPPPEKLLADLLYFLCRKSKPNLSVAIDDLISQLMEQLRNSRCLLILDNFDTILKSGDFVGHYQEGFKGYGQLLKRVGEESHQSCLMITSLEKPREVALLEGETFPVRSLQLEGLGDAAKSILQDKGLSGEEQWDILIRLYRGNPLALKMVASTISELFGGSVSDFLEMSLTGIVQDIIVLIQAQFHRLSPLEKDIMYWLAQEEEALPLTQLRNCLPVSEYELFTALKSLAERSLIEKGPGKFSLQPAVREYVRNQFVDQITKEIDEFSRTGELSVLKLLKSHSLGMVTDNLGEDLPHPIISLVRQKLATAIENNSNSVSSLHEAIASLKDKSQLEIGYALDNLNNILV